MMTALLSRISLFSVCAFPLLMNAPHAVAADYIAQPAPPYAATADNGVCAQQSVLGRVVSGFAYEVRHVPDLPKVGINGVSNIQTTKIEAKERPTGIARTYCSATALLSDGSSRNLWYLIEDGQGFASMGRNVEFCVDGFDPWYVFNGACRVLRQPS